MKIQYQASLVRHDMQPVTMFAGNLSALHKLHYAISAWFVYGFDIVAAAFTCYFGQCRLLFIHAYQ